MKTARWIKYILAALLAVSCFVSMTACSFGSDISKKMMIQGIGIDKEEEGYLVSVHYLRSDEEVKMDFIQSQGTTVYEALQNLTLQTGLIPTYSHNAMVVFSKQCAQEGLTYVFDFFIRYHETRPTVDLFVAQDRAETLFQLQREGQYVLATQAKSFAEADSATNKFAGSTVLDVANRMASEYNAFALPELTLIDEHVQLGRTVYFQDNQLIGYFNREQSRGYLAAVYTIRNGVMVLDIPDIGTISLKLENTSSKITADIVDDVPHFQIEVSCKAYISEINQDLRKKLSLDVYEKFETALNEKLKLQIESAVEQAVIRDSTDIFNFDVALQQQQTEYWKVHRDSWAQELAKIKYTVNVTSSVDRVQQEASPAF